MFMENIVVADSVHGQVNIKDGIARMVNMAEELERLFASIAAMTERVPGHVADRVVLAADGVMVMQKMLGIVEALLPLSDVRDGSLDAIDGLRGSIAGIGTAVKAICHAEPSAAPRPLNS